jgi:hypothetical protein
MAPVFSFVQFGSPSGMVSSCQEVEKES